MKYEGQQTPEIQQEKKRKVEDKKSEDHQLLELRSFLAKLNLAKNNPHGKIVNSPMTKSVGMFHVSSFFKLFE